MNYEVTMIRQMIADGVIPQEVAEKYFPELVESDNERIRKEIIEYIKTGTYHKDWIAWLEKQGEQKSTNSKEDDVRRVSTIQVLEYAKSLPDYNQFGKDAICKNIAWLEKQSEQKPNPYSGTSFEYNGHTWGMCARDGGVEIIIDGHIKGRVFTNDSNAKEMFIKALERVEEQNSKGYKLTDCDKNSWWKDFKVYTSCSIEQKSTWSEDDENMLNFICGLIPYSLNGRMWLKGLKNRVQPQPTWKPSDEHINWLIWVINRLPDTEKANEAEAVLRDLLEQLNKLRG